MCPGYVFDRFHEIGPPHFSWESVLVWKELH